MSQWPSANAVSSFAKSAGIFKNQRGAVKPTKAANENGWVQTKIVRDFNGDPRPQTKVTTAGLNHLVSEFRRMYGRNPK